MSRLMFTVGRLWLFGLSALLACSDESNPDDAVGFADVSMSADTANDNDSTTEPVAFAPAVATMATTTPLWTGSGLFVAAEQDISSMIGSNSILEPIAGTVNTEVGPSLFLAIGQKTATSLVAFSQQLEHSWTFEDAGAGIRRPAIWNDRLLICTESGGAAFAHWIRRTDGESLATVALGTGPVTSPAKVFSGGSHWLVGVGSRLVGLTVADPLAETDIDISVTLELDLAPARVTSVFTSGGWLFGATLWKDGKTLDNGAIGDALYLGGVSDGSGPNWSFITMGFPNPVSTPDWMWTAPVLVTKLPTCSEVDCKPLPDVVFSGGSHWLGGWDVDGGDLVWLKEDLPERITGLAVGDDGVVYSGGSHWFPADAKPGWTLRGTKTVPDGDVFVGQEVLKQSGDDETLIAGIPSPVLADGQLHVVIVHASGTATTTAIGVSSSGSHLCGWPRAYGDLANAGIPITQDWAFCNGD